MAKKDNKTKVSLADYAAKYNPQLNRRHQRMSEGYLYRLIREHEKGKATRSLWFDYVMEGDKDRIYILINQ